MSPSLPYLLKPPIITIPNLVVNMANSARPGGVSSYEGDIFSQRELATLNMCIVL